MTTKPLLVLGATEFFTPAAYIVSDGIPSGQVSVTRASPATYFNSSGIMETAAINEARLDYLQDGSSLVGLRVEGSRTNLITYSEQFDNAVWDAATNAVVTINISAAPDGNATADRLTADSNVGGQRREQTITVTASTEKVLSIWVKAGTQNVGDARLIASGSTNHQLDITPTSEWVRYELQVPNTDTATSLAYRIYPSSSGASNGDNILVWGAQCEEAISISSYIATVATSVLRSADIPTVDLTSVTWFNASEGTLYTKAVSINDSQTSAFTTVVEISDGTVDNKIQLSRSSGRARGFSVVSTSNTAAIDAGVWANTTEVKAAFAYKVNDFAMSIAGAAAVTDVAGALPPGLDTINIGTNDVATQNFNGIITDLVYYDARLSEANLAIITT